MDASDWIAIGALTVALLSLLFTFLEHRDRQRQADDESKDRREELDLLRQQVEEELRDRQHQRRSHLFATVGAVEGGVSGGSVDRHHFTVTNAGPDSADELRFAAVAESGAAVVADELAAVAVLIKGQKEKISLDIPIGPSREGGLRLRATWRDASGPREEDLTAIKRHG